MLRDLSTADGRFIAGFIQAEGHFGIFEQNGGQSVACGFGLSLRDDDRDLVAWLQEVTELGAVRPLPARRNSAPQSSWTISRRNELADLARLLTAHPLYGRKAQQFEIWKEAVAAWNRDPPDRHAMRAARAMVDTSRAYRAPDLSVDITLPPPELLRHFVGGLISGDGHFSLACGAPSMTLKQRSDELPLLRAIATALGLGNTYHYVRRAGHPYATWTVSGTHRCQALAQVLASTIRGKKRHEFELWAATVERMAAQRGGRRRFALAANEQLKELRRYRAPIGRLRRARPPRVLPHDCLVALRQFAEEQAGALDALTYMVRRREKHPEWPARNTVARHFGGWYQALEAAGLAERAARDPDRFANRSTAARDAARAVQRERVLASVRRFISEVGHVPRAMEYFRWRLARDPGSPTQATVYNQFPGGWSAVLAAL